MPELITIPSFKDERGTLSVIDGNLPFQVKRIFYIYDVDNSVRGKHRHHKTIQAAVCIKGSCVIASNNNICTSEYKMDSPEKCLILYPEDYHWMFSFSKGAVLLVLASEKFDPKDYIYEPYS